MLHMSTSELIPKHEQPFKVSGAKYKCYGPVTPTGVHAGASTAL